MLPVYCEHFGLTREPFNVTPDPSFLYLSDSHKEALAQLVYGIQTRRGFVVLTGEVGTGKTTLIQSLLEEIDDGHTHCALLFDLTGSPKDLLRSLCHEFELISPLEKEKEVSEYLALLNRFLLDSYKHGDNVAVIIDEAQNLPAEVLERVRLLSNLETKQEKLLQILLVGQPELSDRLNAPELRQLKQRVALRHHLRSLNLSECTEYIAKRLEISNGAATLFSTAAVEAVHAYSDGIPRLVNILCDNGLLSAYAARKSQVEPAMIAEIAQDLHLAAPRPRTMRPHANTANNGRARPARERSEASFGATGNIEPQEFTNGKSTVPQATPRGHSNFSDPKPAAPSTESSQATDAITAQEREPELELFLPPSFFQSLIGSLTEALGPMAPMIVDDHLSAMHESKKKFPVDRFEQLLKQTSGEIDNAAMRDVFVLKMRKEMFALGSAMLKQ